MRISKPVILSVIILMSLCTACPQDPDPNGRDYREDMRTFVERIASAARDLAPGFIIVPQNGQELLTTNGEPDGPLATAYAEAIDGVGREDLFYGFEDDNEPTPADERDYLLGFTDLAEANGIQPLVTDYCWTQAYVDDSYEQSANRAYISFAADHRELDNVPEYPEQPYSVHAGDVAGLGEAQNFLYLINPGGFDTKAAFLNALRSTDYDLFIIDLFFGDEALSAADIDSLKTKDNGGARLVIAYMSIGEAEDYRYYWREEWLSDAPSWLEGENPDWPGNYKVRYWESGWQDIIVGGEEAYLTRILDAGFDGVYLDIIDAFEYFEDQE